MPKEVRMGFCWRDEEARCSIGSVNHARGRCVDGRRVSCYRLTICSPP
jgi:hypothetical protein